MINSELKLKLKHLVLVGYEDGGYVWIGSRQEWDLAEPNI